MMLSSVAAGRASSRGWRSRKAVPRQRFAGLILPCSGLDIGNQLKSIIQSKFCHPTAQSSPSHGPTIQLLNPVSPTASLCTLPQKLKKSSSPF